MLCLLGLCMFILKELFLNTPGHGDVEHLFVVFPFVDYATV